MNLNLSYLYSGFENSCRIISYHGIDDELVSCKDKKNFAENIKNFTFNEIALDKVDNFIFNSTKHGLKADFINLFEYVMESENVSFDKSSYLDFVDNVTFSTAKNTYEIDYSAVFPKIKIY